MGKENETIIKKRIRQMQECKESLPKLEELYYSIASDLGLLNSSLIDYLKETQSIKQLLKKDAKSIAEFNREFEMTEVYLVLKSFKYQIEGLQKMMAGIRIRIESLKSEVRGQY